MSNTDAWSPPEYVEVQRRREIAAVLVYLALGLGAIVTYFHFRPDAAGAGRSATCRTEDEIVVAVQGEPFDFHDGQLVCIHIDHITPPVVTT